MMRQNFVKMVLVGILFTLVAGFSGRSQVTLVSRYSYYTPGEKGEVLFIPGTKEFASPLSLKLDMDGRRIRDTLLEDPSPDGLYIISFPINGLPQGESVIHCRLSSQNITIQDTSFIVTCLPPKRNGVKIDRLSGGLLVDGLPFIPFGFYNYWPVQATLPEEEVVRGFNMISPYQRIERKSFRKRKKYMDRCAELGMKVNYNLLSVSGGGGVGSGRLHGLTAEEKNKRLVREVLAMKDHPALLTWYIADEPVGQGMPPEPLEKTYELIKKLDPYHPVCMVFMAPNQAYRYRFAMDIVMADPYPVPNTSVEIVGTTVGGLTDTFYPEKPVWLVPQAFGGNEWWQREPTPGEERVMTYLGITHGATGIQYFVRHGFNGFPKSVESWNSCGSVAMETAELTPFYTAGRPFSLEATGHIKATAWQKKDSLLVICINTENNPVSFSVQLPDTFQPREAILPFENRILSLSGHNLTDMIDAMGTRIYILSADQEEGTTADSLNQVVDPGFEYLPVAGIPSATYFRVGRDRGATAFVDSRVAHTGNHALRMVCPEKGKGGAVSFFPVQVTYGKSYCFSFWAKAAPSDSLWRTRGWIYRLFHKKPGPMRCAVELGSASDTTVTLTNRWQQYDLTMILLDTLQAVQRIVPRIQPETRGTVWFDDLRFIQLLDAESHVSVPGKQLEITVKNNTRKGNIYLSFDATVPGPGGIPYQQPLVTDSTIHLTAALWDQGKMKGSFRHTYLVHKALGKPLILSDPPAQKYSGGGNNALVDGQLALPAYRDSHWQGFISKDLEAVIDLDSLQDITRIETRFLQQMHVWILFPEEVIYSLSEDGQHFSEVYSWKPDSASHDPGPRILKLSWKGERKTRYVRVVAHNVGICPDWSDGAGEEAWLFTDEICIY